MIYRLIFHPLAKKEILKLNKSQQNFVLKQLKKIEKTPELGDLLGNKNGYNLSGFRKMYADSKKIRIVYKIENDEVIVEVIAVGKREDMKVYTQAYERVKETSDDTK